MILHVAGEIVGGRQCCVRCGAELLWWPADHAKFVPGQVYPPRDSPLWYFKPGRLVAHENGAMMRVDEGEVDAPACKPMEVDGVDVR